MSSQFVIVDIHICMRKQKYGGLGDVAFLDKACADFEP